MSYPLPLALQEALTSQSHRFVIMTCGIAGSGKSTLSHTLCTKYPNFIRLSIDAYIFKHYGLAGIDCPVPQYARYQEEAKEALKRRFRALLREGVRDVVLDFSFWNREDRDQWREVLREETERTKNQDRGGGSLEIGSGERGKDGVELILVFFDAEESVLWRRIEERRLKAEREERGADNGRFVTRAMLDRYFRGFERPEEDEGAINVKFE